MTPDEPTNTHGCGYGCACVADSAQLCADIRFHRIERGEPCECLCHQWREEDDDD